jgi:hypothetical protein
MEKLTNVAGGQPKKPQQEAANPNAVTQLKQLFEEMGMAEAFTHQAVVNALVYSKGDVDKAMDVLLSGAAQSEQD